MHASMRTYRVKSGSVEGLMRRVDRDFAEALAQEPGFVAYQAMTLGPATVRPSFELDNRPKNRLHQIKRMSPGDGEQVGAGS